jgi:hypothetical protein
MGVGQVLAVSLFFASNAIYPTDIMPGWLKTISHLNPLTYVVDALRTFMLAGSTSPFGLSHTMLSSSLPRPSWSSLAPGCIPVWHRKTQLGSGYQNHEYSNSFHSRSVWARSGRRTAW